MRKNLVILKGTPKSGSPSSDTQVIYFEEFRSWCKNGTIVFKFLKYSRVRLITYSISCLSRPFWTFFFLYYLSFSFEVEEKSGQIQKIGIKDVFQSFLDYFLDYGDIGKVIHNLKDEIKKMSLENPRKEIGLKLNYSPLYLRTDLIFGLEAGGSVSHVGGVINNLNKYGGPPIFCTTDHIPSINKEIEENVISPLPRFWDFPEIPPLFYNFEINEKCPSIIKDRKLSFVYHRYSIGNYAGVYVSEKLKIPLVLEFNGSEVWIQNNWGKKLNHENIFIEIEKLNLNKADLVVVVSKNLKKILLKQGVEESKILVNPNGVDTHQYSPEISGELIREKFNFGKKTVVGFVGTFGQWHGAEILADAIQIIKSQTPDIESKMHFLLVGDGINLTAVKNKVKQGKCSSLVTFTGSVPQHLGNQYMAACDILVSPHIPNSDGTPFFGSPTKLFEYMAMGKPIVASDLEQIGEILNHKETGWLVQPGDSKDLAQGIMKFFQNPELGQRLGQNARTRAVQNHSWAMHTEKIINALKDQFQ